jgi:electron transport complex protein RnfD
MLQVLLALVPLAIVHIALFGPGLLLQLAVASATALACEALALRMRARDPGEFLRDGSVLVTAALLAVSVSPLLPFWLTALGTAVAVLLGKHAYGGLGFNPFNPAMIGYAVLLVSFPVEMTQWPQPANLAHVDWLELSRITLSSVLTGQGGLDAQFDAYTGATTLDALRTGLGMKLTMSEVMSEPPFGAAGGQAALFGNLAALAGGMFLLARGVVRWQIPASMLGALVVLAFVFHVADPGRHAGVTFHLFSGATMLGAFFIATDPVSAATSDRGRLVYGAGIGVITWIIRTWGGYPDGVAFAVLLMNAAAPTIDRFSIPRIYGHPRD